MPADTRAMFGIHDCLRKEFAALPLRVKAVPEGDAERAAVVADHVELMCDVLDAYHLAEDEAIWPVLAERAPEHADLLAATEAEHDELSESVPGIRTQAQAWKADPTVINRATVHTTLIGFERQLLGHLSAEERDVLPVMGEVLSQEEFDHLAVRAASVLTPEQLTLSLGMVLTDTTPEVRDLIATRLPLDVWRAYEKSGQAQFQAYRKRLVEH